MHCHPGCNQFRRCRAYVGKSWAKIVPQCWVFMCFSPILMMSVFFHKAVQKKGATPNRCFFFGWRIIPSLRIPEQAGKSSDLLPGCVETDQHTHHSCSQRKRGLEGPGGETRGSERIICREFLVAFTKNRARKSGETNQKKTPKTVFRPGKLGGTFPCWTVLKFSAAKPPAIVERLDWS